MTRDEEIAYCWERQSDYDWTQDHDVHEECRDMWDAHEGDYEFKDWLNSTFRGDPLPDDLRRHLRNDGVADWYEICVCKD
jgi:hypothetical protein